MRLWWLVALATVSGWLIGGGADAQVTGQFRESFIKNSSASCMAAVVRDNPALPETKIQTYCVCMATAQADITTPEDVAYMNEHGKASGDYQRRLLPLATRCSASAGI